MKKQKKLKGFTLIELIIVLAIFGIILSVVMSLLDPTSKIMKKASTRERTAAYADNISEYITNSITYAKFIRVYDGGFCSNDGSKSALSGTLVAQEQEAALDLVGEMLNDARDRNGNPVTGKVHVLKFINTAVSDADVNLEEGKIYESVYDFQAGARVVVRQDDPANPGGPKIDVVVSDSDDEAKILSNATYVPVINRDVINPEHFEDYSYYYKKGYYTLDPIEDPDNYSKSGITNFASVPVEYYSCLNPIRNISNLNHTLNISVISYAKDKDKGLTGKIEGVENKTTSEKVTLFKSPAHLNSASMALVNAKKVDENQAVMFMKPVRNQAGVVEDNTLFVHATSENGDYGKAFHEYKPTFTGVSDILYVVYIMPNEMSDVKINYGGNSNAPGASTPGASTPATEPTTIV